MMYSIANYNSRPSLSALIEEMDTQLNTLRDFLDVRIEEEFGLCPSVKYEIEEMSFEDIDSLKNEAEAQIRIERNIVGSSSNRREQGNQYMSNLHNAYADDKEWSDKEFIEYIKYVFRTIKNALVEIKSFEEEKNKICKDTENAYKNWFEYANSPEYKANQKKRISEMREELEKEQDPIKKRKLTKSIEQVEASESLSFLFSRLEKNPNVESASVKDTYFDSQKSKLIMNKFTTRITKMGFKADVYKRFFNLEETFLPEEYRDLNNIFLFYVMRFIAHTDVYNNRDKMYVSTVLMKIYNLIYHKYDEQKYENDFIDVIKRVDDYFMPYIDEFKEKNITSPNHPIRKKRDQEYDEKLRVVLIASLQNEGIDVDTNLETEELKAMLRDVMDKKESQSDKTEGEPVKSEEVVTEVKNGGDNDGTNLIDAGYTSVPEECEVYRDIYNYYYKKNEDNNNYTYYDTEDKVYEENVPEDDVLRLVTGGNLVKEMRTIRPIKTKDE